MDLKSELPTEAPELKKLRMSCWRVEMLFIIMIIIYLITIEPFYIAKIIPNPSLVIPITYFIICIVTRKFPTMGNSNKTRFGLGPWGGSGILFTGYRAIILSLLFLVPILILTNKASLIPDKFNISVIIIITISILYSYVLYWLGIEAYERITKYREESYKGLPLRQTKF